MRRLAAALIAASCLGAATLTLTATMATKAAADGYDHQALRHHRHHAWHRLRQPGISYFPAWAYYAALYNYWPVCAWHREWDGYWARDCM
jgi:hypothetical protein